MPKSIRKLQLQPQLPGLKRVAAYARVSTGKDAMLHSLAAQVSYYNNLIQNHDGWLFAGIFADEAATGTKNNRTEFQHMLEKCRNGEIDMIITKSISRFARNTVTLLETVRELKTLGVDVFFEEQNIRTASSDGELMLTILASYAQEESRSASENQKWRIRKNFEEGKPCNCTVLGYRYNGEKFEIVPDEADIVRRIYSEYLSGKGVTVITNELNNDGITTRFNRSWCTSVVSTILSNYAYTGNLLLQKTYLENHITKKIKINNGELPKYHAQNCHNAIIDISVFNAVQEEKAKRAAKFHPKKDAPKKYPFSGLLICKNCGKHYRRKTTAHGIVWICSTYNEKGKSACASKQIPESTLESVTADVLGDTNFSQSQLSSIIVCNNNKLIFNFKDGASTERIWQDRSRSESWTDEMKEAARQKYLARSKK